ncbi:hypothetical protein NHH36_25545 (plasmid) [Klebsiella pneumoniae]
MPENTTRYGGDLPEILFIQQSHKVAVSRGNTFLSAKERFRVQVCFKNAITHPDEDRLLAELLTVHHFLADTSILWHMEQKTYACTTTWATTSTWLPEIYQRQASPPNVVKIIKFMHARFPGLKTVAETNEQGYEQALTSVDFEIPYWPVLPKFESDNLRHLHTAILLTPCVKRGI